MIPKFLRTKLHNDLAKDVILLPALINKNDFCDWDFQGEPLRDKTVGNSSLSFLSEN